MSADLYVTGATMILASVAIFVFTGIPGNVPLWLRVGATAPIILICGLSAGIIPLQRWSMQITVIGFFLFPTLLRYHDLVEEALPAIGAILGVALLAIEIASHAPVAVFSGEGLVVVTFLAVRQLVKARAWYAPREKNSVP